MSVAYLPVLQLVDVPEIINSRPLHQLFRKSAVGVHDFWLEFRLLKFVIVLCQQLQLLVS